MLLMVIVTLYLFSPFPLWIMLCFVVATTQTSLVPFDVDCGLAGMHSSWGL